jgi:hypothetical protein
MENGVAILLFTLYLGHIVTNAWLKSNALFISTQILCILTGISWASNLELNGKFLSLLIFSMLALTINVKHITNTTFTNLEHLNIGKFKDYCMEKGSLNGFEAFTIYGFYALVCALWIFVLANYLTQL